MIAFCQSKKNVRAKFCPSEVGRICSVTFRSKGSTRNLLGMWHIQGRQIQRTESRSVVARAVGGTEVGVE